MSRKLLFICAALMVAASGLAAPTAKGAVKSLSSNLGGSKFGVEAGYAHNWLMPSTSVSIVTPGIPREEYTQNSSVNLDGFYVGPSYHYFFNSVNGLYVQGSILYQYGTANNLSDDQLCALTFDLLGLKSETNLLRQYDKISYTAHSLDVPVRIGYNYTFDNGLGFQIFLGPTFNFALEWKITGQSGNKSMDLNQLNGYIYTKSENGDTTKSTTDASYRALYQWFDIGLGGGVGFTYNWFYLNLSCDWGLTDLCKSSSIAGWDKGTDTTVYYSTIARQTKLKLGIGVRF